MDENVRRIIRQALANDPDAWIQIERALQRQLINLVGLSLWIVVYEHNYGTDHIVFLSEEDAKQCIYNLVIKYWDEEVEYAMPQSMDRALDIYQERSGEFINIEQVEISEKPVPTKWVPTQDEDDEEEEDEEEEDDEEEDVED